MEWGKTVRYQTSMSIGHKVYNVLCESDFDDGFSVYVNGEFVADVEGLPTREQLEDIIAENSQLELTIKTGFAQSGVFDET